MNMINIHINKYIITSQNLLLSLLMYHAMSDVINIIIVKGQKISNRPKICKLKCMLIIIN